MYSWYLNTLDFRFNRKENLKLDFKAELGTEASNLSAQETPSCVASNSALQFSCLFPNLQESQPVGDSMTSFPRASRFSTLNRSFTWIYGGFLLWNPRAASATLMLQWQGGSSGTERWGTLSTPAEWWKRGGDSGCSDPSLPSLEGHDLCPRLQGHTHLEPWRFNTHACNPCRWVAPISLHRLIHSLRQQPPAWDHSSAWSREAKAAILTVLLVCRDGQVFKDRDGAQNVIFRRE